MALMKREDTGTLKRENKIVLCGEVALEEAVDLSQERLCNE
jgi:hypothetical protein